MDYFVYLPYGSYIDMYYAGSTHNPEERLEEHNAGATTSTSGGRPWKLVYMERYESKTEAIKREKAIKKMKSTIRATVIDPCNN